MPLEVYEAARDGVAQVANHAVKDGSKHIGGLSSVLLGEIVSSLLLGLLKVFPGFRGIQIPLVGVLGVKTVFNSNLCEHFSNPFKRANEVGRTLVPLGAHVLVIVIHHPGTVELLVRRMCKLA